MIADRYEAEDLKGALEALESGGVILFPTDSVWSLGCDATDGKAIEKLKAIRGGSPNRDLVVLMANQALIERYVNEVPDIAWQLIEATEKPLTIIYPGGSRFPENLISANNTTPIRVTEELFSSHLVNRFKRPIVSAPASIDRTPYSFNDISEEIVEGVEYAAKFHRDETKRSDNSSVIELGATGEIKILKM